MRKIFNKGRNGYYIHIGLPENKRVFCLLFLIDSRFYKENERIDMEQEFI